MSGLLGTFLLSSSGLKKEPEGEEVVMYKHAKDNPQKPRISGVVLGCYQAAIAISSVGLVMPNEWLPFLRV